MDLHPQIHQIVSVHKVFLPDCSSFFWFLFGMKIVEFSEVKNDFSSDLVQSDFFCCIEQYAILEVKAKKLVIENRFPHSRINCYKKATLHSA